MLNYILACKSEQFARFEAPEHESVDHKSQQEKTSDNHEPSPSPAFSTFGKSVNNPPRTGPKIVLEEVAINFDKSYPEGWFEISFQND